MTQKCQDVMTKDPFCCLPSDRAQQVGQIMRDRNVGAIPICESPATKKLVGVVTDRDLTIRVLAEGRDPKNTAVAGVMTGQVVTCRPEDDVEKAVKLMESRKVRRIPIVDAQDRIVGIITQGDIAIRLKDRQKVAEVVIEVSKPGLAAA